MKCISQNCNKNIDMSIIREAEKTYSISIREDIKDFIGSNAGGYPVKDIIVSNGDEYEVRVFLSLDDADAYYCIRKPLDYFLGKTNGKIIPIGIDSGDNYFCVNNQTGKVYYWSADEDSYSLICNSLNDFTALFE